MIAFLADRADMQIVIVVRGVDQRVGPQREDLRVDRPVKRFGIAALEVGSATTSGQQRVAGKNPRPARSLDEIAMMCVGVAGREQRLQPYLADIERLDLANPDVGAQNFVECRINHLRTGQRAQPRS